MGLSAIACAPANTGAEGPKGCMIQGSVSSLCLGGKWQGQV